MAKLPKIPLAAVAGLGNAVFHPADFAVLNARVDPSRLGRAYGAHGLAGNIGWVLAPIVGVALSKLFGWREAVVIMGAAGLVAAALFHANRDWISVRVAGAPRKRSDDGAAPARRRPRGRSALRGGERGVGTAV